MKQKRPNVRQMVERYGYERTKIKLKRLGFGRWDIWDMTDFLFRKPGEWQNSNQPQRNQRRGKKNGRART